MDLFTGHSEVPQVLFEVSAGSDSYVFWTAIKSIQYVLALMFKYRLTRIVRISKHPVGYKFDVSRHVHVKP